jgi:magnesium transporter
MLEPARGIVNERTATKFRDVHDHARRIIEQIGNVQALVDAVNELQRSEQAMSLSEVTKRLTGWAAIIAVPTFIASFYGMNFRLYPRDQTAFGFWVASGMMLVSGVVLYIYFRRKDWI